MKKQRQPRITPSQERLKELFDYDPKTGIFTRKINRGKWKSGSVAGTLSGDGYININVDYAIYRAHRLAWKYMTGEDPIAEIDHINCIRTDNKFCNLREATPKQNRCNTHVYANNKLGMKGVFKKRPTSKKFSSRVTIGGKGYYLGTFETIEEAKAAYSAASKLIHGPFSRSS